jgi:hypothetical protein
MIIIISANAAFASQKTKCLFVITSHCSQSSFLPYFDSNASLKTTVIWNRTLNTKCMEPKLRYEALIDICFHNESKSD